MEPLSLAVIDLNGEIKYIIALFTPLPEDKAIPNMKEIGRRVPYLIVQRNP